MSVNEERVAKARARIAALAPITYRPGHEGSYVALMFEFLRRSALWAKALAREDVWPLGLAGALLEKTGAVSDLDVVRSENQRVGQNLSRYPRQLACAFIEWAALDTNSVSGYELDPPYEPAIVMLERGGAVQVEQRMFQFGVAGFPMRTASYYIQRPPYTALDAASLEDRDREWSLPRNKQ